MSNRHMLIPTNIKRTPQWPVRFLSAFDYYGTVSVTVQRRSPESIIFCTNAAPVLCLQVWVSLERRHIDVRRLSGSKQAMACNLTQKKCGIAPRAHQPSAKHNMSNPAERASDSKQRIEMKDVPTKSCCWGLRGETCRLVQ